MDTTFRLYPVLINTNDDGQTRGGHGSGFPLIGSGRVGSQNSPSSVGRDGSGPVSKKSTKYAVCTQETDYSLTIIPNDKQFLMIRSCNVAIYYRLLIYSDLVIESNVLDEIDFASLTMAEMIFFLFFLTRHINIFLTTESRSKWVGLGRVQRFMLILGRVGLGHFTCGLDWSGQENWKKIGLTSNSAQDHLNIFI